MKCQPTESAVSSGTKTILLVEDEAIVRKLASRVLLNLGYSVLTAEHPDEALALCADHDGSIDLLITDILMPGMQGVELAERVALSRPGISVVYVSGYANDIVQHKGDPGFNWAFLQKPFTPSRLASAVRAALDGSIS